jgi:hypothetical protein
MMEGKETKTYLTTGCGDSINLNEEFCLRNGMCKSWTGTRGKLTVESVQ